MTEQFITQDIFRKILSKEMYLKLLKCIGHDVLVIYFNKPINVFCWHLIYTQKIIICIHICLEQKQVITLLLLCSFIAGWVCIVGNNVEFAQCNYYTEKNDFVF